MLDILIVILITTIVIFGGWQITKFAIRPLIHRTQINQLLFMVFVFLGFGVMYDCARTMYFIYFGGVWPELDLVCYILKFALLLLGVSAAVSIIMVLNRQSGQKVKRETIIRYFYIIAAVVLSVLNYYTYVETEKIESGFLQGYYNYQLNAYLYLGTLILYIPFFIFIIQRIRVLLRVMPNKRMAIELILLGLLLAALFQERNLNLVGYLVFDQIWVIVIEFSLLAGIAVSGFIMILKYPNLVEEISAYFATKSIYLLWNNGGIILYKHHFAKQESSTPDRLLMGGFLFATSSGLKETLKVKGGIKFIKIGSTFLLFAYGKYIFGISFVSEKIELVHQKLQQLIEKFERKYETDLADWSGDMSIFDSEEIATWVTKLFR